MRASTPSETAPAETTLGGLRATGHVHRPVKAEIRHNLLARLRSGEPRFPGILGFDDTVTKRLRKRKLINMEGVA